MHPLQIIVALGLILLLSGCTTTQLGVLQGHITIGPICPVERPGDPACQPTAETYRTHPLRVGTVQGFGGAFTEKARFYGDENGTYEVELPPGEYVIVSASSSYPNFFPVPVHIDAGKTTTQDISIDTGIR